MATEVVLQVANTNLKPVGDKFYIIFISVMNCPWTLSSAS